jgi:hypothetical protein
LQSAMRQLQSATWKLHVWGSKGSYLHI